MHLIDRATILKFHKDRIEEFGVGTPQALGWKAEANQLARFEILAQIGDLSEKSVLDVGCGHGDLCGFLDEKFEGIDYTGIDHMKAFLVVAAEKYQDRPKTRFYLGDFLKAPLPKADFVLACGAMGYRSSVSGFAQLMIKKMFDSCRIGLGFNMLSRVDDSEGILVAHDPKEVLAFCKTITENVRFLNGYWEEDFTVFLLKN